MFILNLVSAVLGALSLLGWSNCTALERELPEGASSLPGGMLMNFPLTEGIARDSYSGIVHLYDYLDELYPPQGPSNLSYTVTERKVVPGSLEDPNEWNSDYYADARDDLASAGEKVWEHAFGCGPIAIFTMLDYLAGYECPYIYKWQDASMIRASRTELIKEIHRNSVLNVGTTTSMMYLFATETLSYFLGTYELAGPYKLIANGFPVDDSQATVDRFKSIIDEGYPFMVLSVSGQRFYEYHYITCYGYEEISAKRLHDTKTKTLFLTNPNFGYSRESRYGPCYYDVGWLNDGFNAFWAIVPDAEWWDGMKEISITAEDMPFGTGYPSEEPEGETLELDVDGLALQGDIYRLRTQNYENECIVLSPRREEAGTAYFAIDFPARVRRMEVDMAFWRDFSKESISTLTYRLRLERSYGAPTPLGDWKEFDGELSSLGTDREDPWTFATTGLASGFRLTAEDLPIGDSNKGRVVIDEIRLWFKEADIISPAL